LAIGNVAQSINYAKESVKYADKSNDEFLRIAMLTTHADALHQQGNLTDAEKLFVEAEEMQKARQPEHPFLYSLRGFQYCDLLLARGKYKDVLKRANTIIEIAQGNNWLLNIALDNLTIGRTHILQEVQNGSSNFTQATTYLNQAVEGLRKSGQQDDLPRGLLTRAELCRAKKEFPKAQRDLDEVYAIASRSGMRLYLTDYHLESARLCLAMEKTPGTTTTPGNLRSIAREHLNAAKNLINATGYHRRDKEVQDLEQELGVV